MPEYTCRVANPSGEVIERSYVANDEASLRRELEGQDLMLLSVRKRSSLFGGVGRLFSGRSKVSPREFLLFNQEFSALIRAGIPIVTGLDILLERRKNEAFRSALQDVRDRVKSGEALSEAFAAQGEMFPSLYASTMASGERSGELANVLSRFITYWHNLLKIRRTVISALIYPVILGGLGLVLIALLIFFIIPKFSTFLKEMGGELPLISRIPIGIADFCTQHWQILLAVLITSVVSFTFWKRTPGGRLALDGIKLRLPLVGSVVRNYAQNRFTRTLATLQAGGIPLVASLELSAKAVGNLVYEEALLKVSHKVREGKSLWESLDETELIEDIAVQMIKVGESTGMLVEMLSNCSDFTDEEIDAQLQRLVSLVEPLMLIFMAVLVGFMLMAVYMPLIQAYGSGQG
jgi:type IV pilus assembly protein PilC